MTGFDYQLWRDREETMQRRAEQHRLARVAEGNQSTDLRRDLGNALIRLGSWLEGQQVQTDQGAELYRSKAS